MRKASGAVVGLILIIGLAVPVLAHTDSGVDEPWVEAMNQPSYWESRFADPGLSVDCRKFDGHGGGIPSGYEAVVTKGGTKVRVYNPTPDGAFQALGPVNPNGQGHKHFDISWVVKCHIDEIPEETTTTVQEETTTTWDDTTTTAPEETSSTTTTLPPTTTTTTGSSTTAATATSSSTQPAPPSNGTPPSSVSPLPNLVVDDTNDEVADPVTLEALPYTGLDHERVRIWATVGGLLIIVGVLTLIAVRSWRAES